MLFSDYLDQHAVIFALCLTICLSLVVVYTKFKSLRVVYITGASLFTLTATIFLSIGFYLSRLDVSDSDRKYIQSLITLVSQNKDIASTIELKHKFNYDLLLAAAQKKDLTYSDLGVIHYGQVRDTVILTKYSQYKSLVSAEH